MLSIPLFFFFNDTATTEIYTLSLHDALPISFLRATLPADEPVIQFGNKEGYGTIYMFGGIQGAFVPPDDVRSWIYHEEGATYDTPENVEALRTFQSWAQNGYFNEDYNALGYDAAAAEFANGRGAFWIGGNWD